MIVDRILQIIDYKGINKRKFYSETGLSNGFLDKVKDVGASKVEHILNIYPDISLEWLLTGSGEMLKRNVEEKRQYESVANTVAFSEEMKSAEKATVSARIEEYNRMPQVVTVDGSGKDNVVLVPAKAAAGYLLGYGDNKFIESLPTFNLPNINNGTFRMFQVSGHSMFPTISDGSYVVGEWVENWVKEVKDNRIYVIISTDGILIKRVLNRLKRYDNLYLKSDNRRDYPNISLEPSQIKEIWSVKMHLSFELPDPTILYDRVGDLEAEIEHIKSTIKAKN